MGEEGEGPASKKNNKCLKTWKMTDPWLKGISSGVSAAQHAHK